MAIFLATAQLYKYLLQLGNPDINNKKKNDSLRLAVTQTFGFGLNVSSFTNLKHFEFDKASDSLSHFLGHQVKETTYRTSSVFTFKCLYYKIRAKLEEVAVKWACSQLNFFIGKKISMAIDQTPLTW